MTMKKSICSSILDKYGNLHSMFLCLLLSISVSLVCSGWRRLLPVDSSMSLSVTECNWFCQGQSIAPRQASSAGDRGCITVKLYSAYRNDTVCLRVCVCVRFHRNRGDVVIEAESDLTSHSTSPVNSRPMSRWDAAMGSKPTKRRRAKLREAWEL